MGKRPFQFGAKPQTKILADLRQPDFESVIEGNRADSDTFGPKRFVGFGWYSEAGV
jgi:hypothetical protein